VEAVRTTTSDVVGAPPSGQEKTTEVRLAVEVAKCNNGGWWAVRLPMATVSERDSQLRLWKGEKK